MARILFNIMGLVLGGFAFDLGAVKADAQTFPLIPAVFRQQPDPEPQGSTALTTGGGQADQSSTADSGDPQEGAPGAGTSFGFSHVVEEARELASKSYSAPETDTAGESLDYDDYRRIEFRGAGEGLTSTDRFRARYAPRGFLYMDPIEIRYIRDGQVRERSYEPADFNFHDLDLSEDAKSHLGFSGLKLLSPINEKTKFDEVISFQGASFFRALGARTVYGTSARGLAVGTASPAGEEFPVFRKFWVVEPDPDATELEIYALLDSKGLAGAYKFTVIPAADTKVSVEARLFPRRKIERAGVAPLTSMFDYGSQDPLMNRRDFRPNVHDAEGLSILLANGEWVWRPLVNPQKLEISSFAELTPEGFGLMQRTRDFDAYQDLEAQYHKRPSVWVEPKGDWGKGRLVLVEIPTDNEYNDNIVTFWQPEEPWEKGSEVELAYDLYWGLRPSPAAQVARITSSRLGQVLGGSRPQFVVDFDDTGDAMMPDVIAKVSASNGEVKDVLLIENPETGGKRLIFSLDFEGPAPAELRAALYRGERQVSESWLYRWTGL